MYNLYEILDEVRTKYYSSTNLEPPTICWSDEFFTNYFGVYNYFDNNIIISKILNNSDVTREMLASVVYHESLHQDFPEHDRKFNLRANLFPDYKALFKQLCEYARSYHENLQYDNLVCKYSKDEYQVVYIRLPHLEDYPEAFQSYDGEILVEFKAKIPSELCSDALKYFAVFLVESKENYHIVAWCKNMGFYEHPLKIENKQFGGHNISYQCITSFNDTHILPLSCCDYKIAVKEMPTTFKRDKCAVFQINDSTIQHDLDYIESYSEGFMSRGFDPKNIDLMPHYKDIPLKKLKSIHEESYRAVWWSNAVCLKEPTADNFFERALIKNAAGLTASAYGDVMTALQLAAENGEIVSWAIKLSAMTNNIENGILLSKKWESNIKTLKDKELRKSVLYLTGSTP